MRAFIRLESPTVAMLRFSTATVWLERAPDGQLSSRCIRPETMAVLNAAVAANPSAGFWKVALPKVRP